MLTDVAVILGVFLAHFVAVLSGGVGLMVRPLLIFLGIPAPIVIGSSRVANLVTRGVSLRELRKYRDIDWWLAATLAIPSLLGGLFGALIVTQLAGETLRYLVGIMIIAMAAFMLVKPRLGLDDMRGLMSRTRRAIGYVVYGLANAVATLSGGGGALTSASLVIFFGETYISSAIVRKVAGYAGAMSSAAVFIASGLVSWYYVILIVLAGSLGSVIGIRVGLKGGERWVKRLVLVVIIAAGVGLLLV